MRMTLSMLLPGCGSRVQHFNFRHNLYKLREERDMKPSTFGALVSAMLYEKRCVVDYEPRL